MFLVATATCRGESTTTRRRTVESTTAARIDETRANDDCRTREENAETTGEEFFKLL